MKFDLYHQHPWQVSPKEAVEIQHGLVRHVREERLPAWPKTIAGLDVSVRGNRVQTAIVVMRLPELAVVDEVTWQDAVQFPYVPGLLSFREVPAILPALERLSVRPEVLMLDGQGRAHPRRLGLAAHLGVLLDWPAFGVAKSRLIGQYEAPGLEKGNQAALTHQGERIGTVLRTRTKVNPVYVSVGHRITLEEAVALTLACTTRYKVPEPTRLAHHLSRQLTMNNEE